MGRAPAHFAARCCGSWCMAVPATWTPRTRSVRRLHDDWERLHEKRLKPGSAFSRTTRVIMLVDGCLKGGTLQLQLMAATVGFAIEPHPVAPALPLPRAASDGFDSDRQVRAWQIAPSLRPAASCGATPTRTTPCVGRSHGFRCSSCQVSTWRCATPRAHGSLQHGPVE